MTLAQNDAQNAHKAAQNARTHTPPYVVEGVCAHGCALCAVTHQTQRELGVGLRSTGTNPRALGANPKARGITLRQMGVSPRDLGTNPRALGTNPRARRRWRS